MNSQTYLDEFIKLLVKCPPNKLEQLFHQLINLYCGQNLPSYEEYSKIWTLFDWWDLINASRYFFKHFKSNDELLSKLLSSIPNEHKNIIEECLDIRMEDIRNALKDGIHSTSPAYLKDFDWKLKLTIASDKKAQINEPRLLLDLDIQKGNEVDTLYLDLSKKELKTLIDTMEKANKAFLDNYTYE